MEIYPERYCAYLRKSRTDRDAELRGEGETLARHRALLTDFAEKSQISISEYYCEVVSGDTIEDRPVMQRLLRDVETGMWDGVLVVEVERLARGNTRDQGIVADAFKYSGTRIITPSKTYDPTDEFDEEYFEFGLFMSRREYKTINRRLQQGRISSVKEGKFVGGTAPYGYRRVKLPHEKGFTLEPVPEQAEIVKQIFEWYCRGEIRSDGTLQRLGAGAIADRLDKLGIKPALNRFWSRSTIADMLRNQTYAGYVFFGRQKEIKASVNGKVVKMRQSSGERDYICVKGRHPAIIDEETFRLAGSVRSGSRNNTLPASRTLQNPLSGLVYCKICGKRMTRLAPNSRCQYSTLKCPTRGCPNISSPVFLVEEQLLLFLNHWLEAYELNIHIPCGISVSNESMFRQSLLEKLKMDTDGLQGQLNRAYTLLEQGVYSIETFQERRRILNQNIDQLEASRRKLVEEAACLEKLRAEQEAYVPRVRRLLDSYPTGSTETNNLLLREILDKVIYSKDSPNRRGGLRHANFTLEIFPKLPALT